VISEGLDRACRAANFAYLMRNYHLVVVLKDAPEAEEHKKGVVGLLGRHNAKVTDDQKWGTRRLPHGMQHEHTGGYSLVSFQADGQHVRELAHDLQIQPGVLRFMICRADGK
jgi:ribosomal protein S6